jgi:hypothetical protein
VSKVAPPGVDLSFIKFPVSGAYPIARSGLPQDVNEEPRCLPAGALAEFHHRDFCFTDESAMFESDMNGIRAHVPWLGSSRL